MENVPLPRLPRLPPLPYFMRTCLLDILRGLSNDYASVCKRNGINANKSEFFREAKEAIGKKEDRKEKRNRNVLLKILLGKRVSTAEWVDRKNEVNQTEGGLNKESYLKYQEDEEIIQAAKFHRKNFQNGTLTVQDPNERKKEKKRIK